MPKEDQMSYTLDKDVTTTILNLLKELRQNVDRETEEIRKTICEQIENINKEIQIIMKTNQRKIVELKSIITKIKNLLQGFNSRFENAEEKKVYLKIGQLKLSSLRNRTKTQTKEK